MVTVSSREWAVRKPNGQIVQFGDPENAEEEARDYVAAGNADGSRRYQLLVRQVGPWVDGSISVLAEQALAEAREDKQAPHSHILAIKLLRGYTDCGLREAKDAIFAALAREVER